ncbi:MAG TPA: MerR family transcriptional regulator [Chitinophagales bacterium]|nr:MerR family transcriptional regulator [Chitinophagales bacterium]HNI55445.1 MerR family transcriptional regulator [Chitinophagales bacterium]HNO29003.1 MerR family transcriptional regulator [Chitinophagales bacterium]
MPYKEKEIEKVYWSIGEVAEMLDLSFAQIRLWEKEFDVFQLKKNKKGDRYFTKKDIEQLKLIKFLLKEKKYTIKGAREQLKSKKPQTDSRFQTIEALKKIRQFLVELKEQI